jgi:hypothetical protein
MKPSAVTFHLSEEALAVIAEKAAAIVVEQLRAQSPWMTRAQAADYLGVPASRLEKDKNVPRHRWDGRVLYNRVELDAWLGRRAA